MSWLLKTFRCGLTPVSYNDTKITSHYITLDESNSASSSSKDSSLIIQDYTVLQTQEPEEEKSITLEKKTRECLRTMSSGYLHILLNGNVIPQHYIDYNDILPPPKYIYLKDIYGKFVHKEVLYSKKGSRYIKTDKGKRVYLKDLQGLYRYNSV
jgi:hypothetical protein